MSDSIPDHDVAIVGAGAAGIGAARRLIEHGLDIVVLEAREWLHSADRNPWTAIAQASGFSVDEKLPDWGTRLRRAGIAPGDEASWYAARDEFYRRLEIAGGETPDRAAAALLPPDGRWNGLLGAISTWSNGVELDRVSVQDHLRY